MEDSVNSINYMTKSLSSPARAYSTSPPPEIEESSWTVYFEDFINGTKRSSSFNYKAPSIASDPAHTCSEKNYKDHHLAAGLLVNGNSERLCSKKRNSKPISVDHDLEDTASSPIQSPKVDDFNESYIKSRGMCSRGFYQVKLYTGFYQDCLLDPIWSNYFLTHYVTL
ncbi:hypothetical protein Dimus_019110 [Dionaea muscipula]